MFQEIMQCALCSHSKAHKHGEQMKLSIGWSKNTSKAITRASAKQ